MSEFSTHTVIVCNWHECPFVSSALTRFSQAHGLTPREREVLAMVVDGMATQRIAEELVLSQGTVKAHLHGIYAKAGVSGRFELMEAFREFGLGLDG